ncbi:MAG: ABC transporter permease [Chitinophagaceae bacterium]|nr:ABC transporter permease [Chitinophagaceae bacterium]
MPQQYSQIKGMLAITRASLLTTFKSPQAVFFSLFFPIVLIAIFGALSGGNGISIDVAFDSKSDTGNVVYQVIKSLPVLKVEHASEEELNDRLKKGRITALINIQKEKDSSTKAQYDIHLKSTSASKKDLPVLESVLRDVINKINSQTNPEIATYAAITHEEVPGRIYRMIDFYLPGMLGFSLIGSAVFGVAFVLYSLRETLVLKRMYTTPIKRGYIILGEGIGRILFQMTTAVVIILFGTFVYHFTLSNGWVTFVELMVISFIGLLVFMGFGFVISSVAKNQNVIPIYANLFMFPQYFLSGTFFPKSLLPEGMQGIIKFLPLTAMNDAMRNVAFEGSHLTQCGPQLAILGAWALLIYGIAVKVFRWE